MTHVSFSGLPGPRAQIWTLWVGTHRDDGELREQRLVHGVRFIGNQISGSVGLGRFFYNEPLDSECRQFLPRPAALPLLRSLARLVEIARTDSKPSRPLPVSSIAPGGRYSQLASRSVT
jgi:hypothetical protein